MPYLFNIELSNGESVEGQVEMLTKVEASKRLKANYETDDLKIEKMTLEKIDA